MAWSGKVPGILVFLTAWAGCTGDSETSGRIAGYEPPPVPSGSQMAFHFRDENGKAVSGSEVSVCAHGKGSEAPACGYSAGVDISGTLHLEKIYADPEQEYSFEISPPTGYTYYDGQGCQLQGADVMSISPNRYYPFYEYDGKQETVRIEVGVSGRTARTGKFKASFLDSSHSCSLVVKKMKYAWKSGNDGPVFPDTSKELRIPVRDLGTGRHPIIFKAYAEDIEAVYDTTLITIFKWEVVLDQDTIALAKGVRGKLGFRIGYRGLDNRYSFYAIFRPKSSTLGYPSNLFGLDSVLIPEWGGLYGYRNNVALLGRADRDSGWIARTLEIQPPALDGYQGMNLEIGLFPDRPISPISSRHYEFDLN